jgi:hypothetical protein
MALALCHYDGKSLKGGESVMSPTEIVRGIDETIRDPRLPREKKIELLENLAVAYWKEVFPEYDTLAFENLAGDEMAIRWAKTRKESGVDHYAQREHILYVLDWPASEGIFYWVK